MYSNLYLYPWCILVGGYGTAGDGGVGGISDEQLMLSDLPEPPIAVSDIGPIPPPPMFSSPSPTRHHHTSTPHHSHQHALVQHPLSDCKCTTDAELIYLAVPLVTVSVDFQWAFALLILFIVFYFHSYNSLHYPNGKRNTHRLDLSI